MKLDELHNGLFELLCLIDDICKKENVTYFLDSGTELGAIREHNFIPWDDDMDIKVKADDYEKFKAAIKKNAPDYIKIIEPQDFAPAFYDFTVRICDTRYKLRRETDEDLYYKNYQNYLGTDVFLLSNVPNKFIHRIHIFTMKILYGMAMSHRYLIKNEKYTFLQKIQISVLAFAGKNVSVESICKKWMSLVTKYNNSDCMYCFPSNYSPKELGYIFSNSLFETTTNASIRDRKFPVPIGYDCELKEIYGDYMTPPDNLRKYILHSEEEEIKIMEEILKERNKTLNRK